MSTSIYNGFKLSFSNIFNLNKEISKLRKKANHIAEEDMVIYMYERLISFFDHTQFYDNLDNIEFLNFFDLNEINPTYPVPEIKIIDNKIDFYNFTRYCNQVEIYAHNKNIRVFLDSPEFNLYLFPIENSILGIYETENRNLSNLLKETKTYQEYHYQNSTDKPHHITPKEWNKRYNNWRETLISKSYQNVDEIAITYTIVPINVITNTIYKHFSDIKSENMSGFLKNRILENFDYQKRRRAFSIKEFILTKSQEWTYSEKLKLIDKHFSEKNIPDINKFIRSEKFLDFYSQQFKISQYVLFERKIKQEIKNGEHNEAIKPIENKFDNKIPNVNPIYYVLKNLHNIKN